MESETLRSHHLYKKEQLVGVATCMQHIEIQMTIALCTAY